MCVVIQINPRQSYTVLSRFYILSVCSSTFFESVDEILAMVLPFKWNLFSNTFRCFFYFSM